MVTSLNRHFLSGKVKEVIIKLAPFLKGGPLTEVQLYENVRELKLSDGKELLLLFFPP